ncbi:MAG: kynureninase [Acidimicrobiales bacterium]
MPPPTSADVERLDAGDPLAGFRYRFLTTKGPVAYLDGNSLGRPPIATITALRRLMEQQWGTRLVRAWDDGWAELPERVGDRLGATVLGAAPGQTVVADSTTVNLYKAVHAAAGLRSGRDELVIDSANFPTDRFVVEAVAAALQLRVRWIPPDPDGGVTPAALEPRLGPRTAAVVLSHVDYRSAFLADMRLLTDLVHAAGGVVIWDVCHSAGVVPICLDDDGADFAVGCTYKYLNAGPGAPALLYTAARHHAGVSQPIAGWFGARDVFAMAAAHEPAPGIRRMLSGTPNVLGTVAVNEGLNLIGDAGIAAIRAKSVALTELAVALADELLVPLGWRVASPRDPARRGSHIVVGGAGAAGVVREMAAGGVIADFRLPDLVRIGLSPLTTSFAEVWTGMHAFRAAAEAVAQG